MNLIHLWAATPTQDTLCFYLSQGREQFTQQECVSVDFVVVVVVVVPTRLGSTRVFRLSIS